MTRQRSAAIVIKDGAVLLIHRITPEKEYWTFPGGGVEAGETPAEAVVRELEEETTLHALRGPLLYTHIYDDGDEEFFWRCNYVCGEARLPESAEEYARMYAGLDHYEPIWLPLDRLSHTLIYPLEIRDWLIDDLSDDFVRTPREAHLIKSVRREA